MVCKNRNDLTITLAQMNLLFRLRILWRELTTWIRTYLNSRFIVGNYYQDVFTRLYRIPTEFANLLKLVFGEEIANQYAQLLSNQIIRFRDYIEALINGDETAANNIYREFYQGADERAGFLVSINPFWDEREWRDLIYTFLNLNIQEITAFLTGNYEQSINIFDTLLSHSDMMGDYFTDGLYDYITFQNGGIPTGPTPTPAT